MYKTIVRFSNIGLPITTVFTLILFFLGVSYYTGYLYYYGILPSYTSIPFQLYLIPSFSTFNLLIFVTLDYSISQFYLKLAIKNKKDYSLFSILKENLSIGLSFWSIIVFLFQLLILFITSWSNTLNIIGGLAIGTILAFVPEKKNYVDKLIFILIALFIACTISYYHGRINASELNISISITTKGEPTKESFAKKIFENEYGIFIIRESNSNNKLDSSVIFIPRDEIKSITYIVPTKNTR